MLAVYILLAAFLAITLLRVVVCYYLARLLKAGAVTWRRAAGVIALMVCLGAGALAWLWSRRFPPGAFRADPEQFAVILACLLVFAVTCLATRFILRGSFWRGSLALLLTAVLKIGRAHV